MRSSKRIDSIFLVKVIAQASKMTGHPNCLHVEKLNAFTRNHLGRDWIKSEVQDREVYLRERARLLLREKNKK